MSKASKKSAKRTRAAKASSPAASAKKASAASAKKASAAQAKKAPATKAKKARPAGAAKKAAAAKAKNARPAPARKGPAAKAKKARAGATAKKTPPATAIKKKKAAAAAVTNKAPPAVAKKKAPPATRKNKVIQRRDGSGHLDPAHAARLHEMSENSHESSSDRGFLPFNRSREPLAEELGESAVSNMTSGEDGLPDALDEKVDEENGGPFVETSAEEEFAKGTDESNIAEATREPFPRTTSGSD